jgi:hypothetical protein
MDEQEVAAEICKASMRDALAQLSDANLLTLSVLAQQLCTESRDGAVKAEARGDKFDASTSNSLAWLFLAAGEWLLTELERRRDEVTRH